MSTASLALSKELYELSKWDDSFPVLKWTDFGYPTYDLGYLRKAILDGLSKGTYTEEEYTEIIENLANALVMGEDSTCEYAVKLFKEEKLKKASHD